MCYDLYCADGEHDGGLRCFTAAAVDGFVRAMDRLGMLDHGAPKVDWAGPDDGAALTEDDWQALVQARSTPGTPLSPAAAEYQRQERLHTDHQIPNPSGIPEHKLRTNDGWLVTAPEIRAALLFHAAAGTQADTPRRNQDEAPGWRDWIGWLESAAPRGGFRVY